MRSSSLSWAFLRNEAPRPDMVCPPQRREIVCMVTAGTSGRYSPVTQFAIFA